MKSYAVPVPRAAFALFAAAVVVQAQVDWDKIPHVVTKNPGELRVAAADSVAARLGVHRVNKDGLFRSSSRALYQGRFSYFGGMPLNYAFFLSYPPVDEEGFPVLSDMHSKYRYGFSSPMGGVGQLHRGGGKEDNLEIFLLSAYRQQIDSVYRDTLTDVRDFPAKSMAEFDARNWISAGYATQYAYKDHPFYGSNPLLVGGGYAVDALSLFIMFGGLVTGKTMGDKAAFFVLGAGINVYWKLLLSKPVAATPIRLQNAVLRSGYKIPELGDWPPEEFPE
jgi:hypothetical protein